MVTTDKVSCAVTKTANQSLKKETLLPGSFLIVFRILLVKIISFNNFFNNHVFKYIKAQIIVSNINLQFYIVFSSRIMHDGPLRSIVLTNIHEGPLSRITFSFIKILLTLNSMSNLPPYVTPGTIILITVEELLLKKITFYTNQARKRQVDLKTTDVGAMRAIQGC